MLSIQQGLGYAEPVQRERFGRNVTLAHGLTLVLVGILALAAWLTLDRAIHIQRESALAVDLTNRERMLSQRVASLAAQFALGNRSVRFDLRSAIDSFERTHWQLVSGDDRNGIRSVVADSALTAIYFNGSTPLDAIATEYVTHARRIAAATPHDPSLGAQTAPLFLAAQAPLDAALESAVRIRTERAGRQLAALGFAGMAICVTVLMTLLAANLAVFRPMARRIVKLTRETEELTRHATTDPLTGTLNKRSFQARGAIEIQKARRYQRPLSLLMIDSDQLAAIENKHGHDGGEALLKALTSSLFSGTRVSDLVARVDEEQFAILLPETSCEGAQLLAERLRRKISDLNIPIDDKVVSCTVSIGVAAAEKDAAFLWPTFKRADEALYEAKIRGRNRVVVAA